jgi:hypothetical protein
MMALFNRANVTLEPATALGLARQSKGAKLPF